MDRNRNGRRTQWAEWKRTSKNLFIGETDATRRGQNKTFCGGKNISSRNNDVTKRPVSRHPARSSTCYPYRARSSVDSKNGCCRTGGLRWFTVFVHPTVTVNAYRTTSLSVNRTRRENGKSACVRALSDRNKLAASRISNRYIVLGDYSHRGSRKCASYLSHLTRYRYRE